MSCGKVGCCIISDCEIAIARLRVWIERHGNVEWKDSDTIRDSARCDASGWLQKERAGTVVYIHVHVEVHVNLVAT